MKTFADILDQEAPISGLLTLVNQDTIPHALLFTGIDGIGKTSVARLFAMAVKCDRRETAGASLPCGHCRNCRRIEGGLHPDVLQIEPQGAFMRIDQIRALCNTLALKPYEAGLRLAILKDAQALNPEAGNALLKVLEEPPDRTILILTATQTSDLLPTIVSRCRRVPFNPLGRETLAALLVKHQQTPPAQAATLAAMAGGSYAKATAMAKDDWAARRRWVLAGAGLLNPATMGELPINRLLAYAEQLVKSKAHLDDALELIKSWLRDLLVARYAPGQVLHEDLMAALPPGGLDDGALLARYNAVEAAQSALRANANPRLCIETLVLTLAGRIAPPPLAAG